MNTNIYSMSANELQKIFPDAYYTKYANHLKILEFQKIMLEDEDHKGHLHFSPRKTVNQRRIRSSMPKQQSRKAKISQYDTFQDTISKNKRELKRYSNFNAILELKLKLSPKKHNTIRSPAKNQRQLENSVFYQMKAIEDMEFQRKQKNRRQIKIQLEKKSICKFVNKCRTARSSVKSRLNYTQDNPQQKIKTQRLALKLSEIAMESLQKNSSINLNCSKVIDREASYINNINTAIKKSQSILKKAGISGQQEQKVLKIFKDRTLSKTSCGFRDEKEKRSLIQETHRIRQQTKSMVTLKRYDVILEKRAAQKNLQSL